MRTRHFWLSTLFLLAVLPPVWSDDRTPPAPTAAPVKVNTATVPVPREGDWMKRNESMNARVKQGNVDLIFIGDSITYGYGIEGGNATCPFEVKLRDASKTEVKAD